MTRTSGAVVIALLLSVVVGSAACEDDSAQTRRREKERTNRSSVREDAEVFMEIDAGQAEIDSVRVHLEESVAVVAFTFLSKQDAYEEFKRLFADMPDLIEGTEPDELPSSFRFALAADADPDELSGRLEALRGVDAVVFPEQRPRG
ncbi:MAG: permease-like cell division protein FtsX [Acidimicrobiia bacterium]